MPTTHVQKIASSNGLSMDLDPTPFRIGGPAGLGISRPSAHRSPVGRQASRFALITTAFTIMFKNPYLYCSHRARVGLLTR